MSASQTTTVGQLHKLVVTEGQPAECAIRLRSASIAFFRLRAMFLEGRGISISFGHRIDPTTGDRWPRSRHGGIYLAVPHDSLIDVVGMDLPTGVQIDGLKFLDMDLVDAGQSYQRLSLVSGVSL